MQPIINFINSQMLEDQNYSLIVQKLLLAVPKYKIAKLEAWYLHQTLISDIKRGELQVANVQADFDSYINHTTKEKALSKIYNSQDYYNYERDFNIMIGSSSFSQEVSSKNRNKNVKLQQMLRQKKTDQQVRRQFLKKLKLWEEQKKKLAKKRQLIQMKKQLLQNSSEEKKRKQEDQIDAFVKLQKKKVIEGRLKAIEQRRAKRQEILEQSSVRRQNSLPKFIEYQNKFKREELKKSLQEKILLKNRKMSLQMNLQQIKQHQKAYINRIKERLNMKSPQNAKSAQKPSKNKQESFNLFKRNPDEMKKLEDKIKRIKKFENKLRLIPLKIDEEKKLESQIVNDKLKNKHKYVFLSQKALSDEQIYREFKDFDINIDEKQVGNKYLDEFKQKNKFLKRKVQSEKLLPVKSEYKDYLKEFKQKKKSVLNPDQFDVYVRKADKTAKRQESKQLLMQKSQFLQKKAIEKIIELKNINKYQDSIKKEEQIDDNFAKAIKAKIALAKIT